MVDALKWDGEEYKITNYFAVMSSNFARNKSSTDLRKHIDRVLIGLGTSGLLVGARSEVDEAVNEIFEKFCQST